MRLWLAFRVFFAVLFNSQLAAQIEPLLAARGEPAPSEADKKVEKPAAPAAPTPVRNDAITLLAALQREARFVDIVQEPLGEYSDQQIGAAARDVLRDCGSVLDRLFALQPLVDDEEGAELETSSELDTGRYRLTGNVSGDPPFRGQLVHHGWQATRCELPSWSGSREAALVVSPIEIEVR